MAHYWLYIIHLALGFGMGSSNSINTYYNTDDTTPTTIATFWHKLFANNFWGTVNKEVWSYNKSLIYNVFIVYWHVSRLCFIKTSRKETLVTKFNNNVSTVLNTLHIVMMTLMMFLLFAVSNYTLLPNNCIMTNFSL